MFLELSHPVTNKRINIFTPEVIELMRSGYTIDDILTLGKKTPPWYNRYNIFTDDMILNYVKYMNLEDIKSICLTDKKAQDLYNSKYLWKNKIEHVMSQRESLNDAEYIGGYKLHDYNLVVNAINKSDQLCNNQTTFYFYNKENLSKINRCIDHDFLLYNKQVISIGKETNQNKFSIKYEDEEYRYEYKITCKYIYRVIFNIFYYFPDVEYVWNYK